MNDKHFTEKTVTDGLEIDNLTYQYPKGKGIALSNIKVHAKKKKLIALMGKTGAGKTTLLSTMNGLVPQFFEGELNGTIKYNGKDTGNIRIQQQIKNVGLVLQDPETQIFGMTVEKDIAFGPSNLNYPKDRIKQNINKAAQIVGLQEMLNKSPEQLSGGERQRLAIAGVLALDSPFLVMDEPTSELDPQGARTIYDAIRKMVDSEDRTIIFSSHHPDFVLEEADELWVLESGRLIFTGKAKDFFSSGDNAKKCGIQIPEVLDLFLELRRLKIYNGPDLPVNITEGVSKLRTIFSTLSLDNKADWSKKPTQSDHKAKIVEMQSIHYNYPGGSQVLEDVSVDIFEQEIVAIIGKNGAGKTTLAKQINGLLKPTAGTVLINGDDVKNLEVEDLSEQIGYVFQNPDHQIFSSSVYEEIEYGLQNIGIDEEYRKERITEALELTGLSGKENIHPFNLSKGERQKLALASVLSLKPKIIIIDEPTTGLDWQGAIKIMGEIRNLKERGHTVIIISHNIRLVAEFADRVIIMKKGQIIRDGDANEVLSDIGLLKDNALYPTQISILVAKLSEFNIPPHIINTRQMINFMKGMIR